MSNLYDDLKVLAQIPHAYETWTDYRERLSGFFMSQTEPGSTALIVGAGACSDLALQTLCEHFSEIRLLDRDADALREGVRRQRAQILPDRLICADLLGVSEETYRAIADGLLSEIQSASLRPDPARFERCLKEAFAQALRTRTPDPITAQAALSDHVICCGVHSQLLTTFLQMASVYRRYVPFRPEAIESFLREQLPSLVFALNDTLFRWAKRSVIFGLEECRIGIAGGVDGAWQAFSDLERRGVPIAAEQRLIWPFDPAQGKAYSMRILQIEKEDQ